VSKGKEIKKNCMGGEINKLHVKWSRKGREQRRQVNVIEKILKKNRTEGFCNRTKGQNKSGFLMIFATIFFFFFFPLYFLEYA